MVAGWAGGLAQWGVVACWAEAQWGGGCFLLFFSFVFLFFVFFSLSIFF